MTRLRALRPLLALLVLAPAARAAGGGDGRGTVRPAVRPMVRVPAGAYRPLYGAADGAADAPAARVASFRLDRDPVTRGDFLAFVRAHPAWRRSAVTAAPPARADRAGYLADWRGDLDPSLRSGGDAADRRRPVTGVSRLAARAYCAARGKRLPTVTEWEYAAAASPTARDAAGAAVGAADPSNYPAFLRSAVRAGATDRTTLDALGFRCAA